MCSVLASVLFVTFSDVVRILIVLCLSLAKRRVLMDTFWG